MAKAIGMMVITFMLAVTSYAEATCAWVLWNEETKSGAGWRGVKWTLKEAAASQAECKRAEQAQIKLFTTPPEGTWKLVTRDLLVANLGVSAPDLESGKQYSEVQLRILCLPDTIDPRGPKGGGL